MIDTSDLNDEERSSILKICAEYNEIFHLRGDKLTYTDAVTHDISTTPNSRPIHTRPYRLPEATKGEINNQINDLIKNNIIRNSKSPWLHC